MKDSRGVWPGPRAEFLSTGQPHHVGPKSSKTASRDLAAEHPSRSHSKSWTSRLLGDSHIQKAFSRHALRKRSRRRSRDDFVTHRGPQGGPSIPLFATTNCGFQGCLAISVLQEPSPGTHVTQNAPAPLSRSFWDTPRTSKRSKYTICWHRKS